ncbi:hypothetical protein LEP1GSC017_1097 [Leptospira meyeri serovar Hardjo str. Went 5]|nr:hypothetical protein LEP1GSC017_1097 [Leptospira meyeri serovar Hardjo str. Went 5]
MLFDTDVRDEKQTDRISSLFINLPSMPKNYRPLNDFRFMTFLIQV